MNQTFSLKIGGGAGQGIKSAGLLFSKFASLSGYYIYNYIEYPSLIRGGHNAMQINISGKEVTGPSSKTDFLVALNQDTLDKHTNELTEKSGILFDVDEKIATADIPKNTKLFKIPLSNLAGEKNILSNTVALGALVAIFGGDFKILKELISKEYEKDETVKDNLKAAEVGYTYITENYPRQTTSLLKFVKSEPKLVLNGNEAVAKGAISARLKFAAIYPMSPISGILHFLTAHQKEHNYIYKQPEDEISAINMAIGASFAGARSMVATSGGGFCLMTEGYGLAGMTETPVVIINGMRGAPATGIPTWSEQSDLQFVLNAHQGDFPRIVLAAGDAQEAFELTRQAFNLADKYQTPVVVLIDKNICDNDQSFLPFENSPYTLDRGKFTTEKVGNYKRYGLSKDGISTRTVPGSGNFFIANSDEHNELGFSSEEIENRNNQMEKRMGKLSTCAKNDMPAPKLFGPTKADITIVSWGSNKGSIIQALKEFGNVNYLHITWMSPFPTEQVKKVLDGARYVVDIECNYSGQLANLIREKTGIEIKDKLLKYDGRPFFVEEIINKINCVLKDLKND
ncbi:MAG: 2-oxoacid:acceptor oxidoreductase subunit alpha [Candidatus Portnoybacteria bacterium CG10_big_fil_rev_8_21_14_0_10_44_7]|uniref:2-oxoacid:acceptor oxidoreductase subunit alpha n=1 Tax=Candidatus Portnoybacteria bacterium CG10_big_fil_rev_8_21_14_0_10_44_7 TaxID=1974816 RepID=A0A2M8KJC8_9BACT|nr:MAG: 2-oxoacid:acceptor oxidoreductase subunit alpha [Candidatus Portnoybacteria bacterium CG10_big_fil_rev_8_21_14_0_10_44_7]